MICIALTRGIAAVSVGSIFLNVGSGLLSPSFSHRVLDLAPESIRGRALGLLFTAKSAGPFLNTALIAGAMTEFGHRQVLFAIGVLVVASVGLRAASSRINLLSNRANKAARRIP